MSSPTPNPLAPTGGPASETRSSAETMRRVVAAFLSSFVPGVGQLYIGELRKGTGLLLAFAALLACVWGFRMLRLFEGFLFTVVTWLILTGYASCAALLKPVSPVNGRRLSKWWLLVIPPIIFIGFNATFTPFLLLSGFRALKFSSTATQPTILAGDYFIFDKNYYVHHPVVGDDLVVVLRNNVETVKRVIAVGGDTIEARDRQIFVNGKLLDEPFIEHIEPLGTYADMDSFGPIAVPEGKYFVMGDNRDISLDSRTAKFGMLETAAILGRPLYVYRSPQKARRGRILE
jgi:signal peptidase I